MALWGIKYMDVDERWWVDLVIQAEPPEVATRVIGTGSFCEGFMAPDGRLLVRRASIDPADLSDWPTDSPVVLRPARRETA
jgi:hypothetical protein